jgi:ribosomal protein S18 acetylase RimI-like enzyme
VATRSYHLAMSVPRNGLVLELLLNGSADDTSGAGHHGVIHGATFTADRFGRPGAAGLFDGVDDHIAIDPPLPLDAAFTVSLWARIDTGAMQGWSNCLIAQDDGDDNDQSRRVFQLSVYDGRVVWHRMINARDPTSRRLIVPGAWFHAVAVVENSRHRLYVDGVLQDSVTHSGRRHATEPIYIGRKGTSESCFFTRGAIDDVRVYNRALGADEIAALYREDGFVNPVDAGRLSARPISGLWGLDDEALLVQRLQSRGESLLALTFRDATVEDIPRLAALHVKTWADTYPMVRRPPTFAIRESQWIDAFATADGSWFCIVIESAAGELIGFAKGLRTGASRGDLNKIYLLSEYQRMGLGRRLVGHVVRRFLAQGITQMTLSADAGNPSCRFYLALGAEYQRDDRGRAELGAFIWRDLQALASHCPVDL